jgi:hypothetical protein
MGYTTEFSGRFLLSKPLDKELHSYLLQFAQTRRMKRDTSQLYQDPDNHKDYGIEGEFYVGGLGDFGQDEDPSIIDYNKPPSTQPSLWCQWVPSEDGTGIEWDGGEKFYNYKEWIKYILKNFLIPKGYDISGKVHYQGEDPDDFGDLDGQKLTHEILSEMNIQTVAVQIPPPTAPSKELTVLKPRKIRLN